MNNNELAGLAKGRAPDGKMESKAAAPKYTTAAKNSALGSMWSKAPPKSAAANQKGVTADTGKPAPAKAVDAQAQLQAQSDVSTSFISGNAWQ